jgi:hypothetical protein
MNKKHIQTTAITSELKGASLFFAKQTAAPAPVTSLAVIKETQESTQESTSQTTQSLGSPRQLSSENPRKLSRGLPTRDEIQGFSFRLRDELKVKVQAEVPHQWQDRLEDIARELKVKKLELYRFILGDFLGEVEPGK